MSFPIPPEGADWAIRWFTDPGWPVKPSPDLVTRLEAAVTRLEEMGDLRRILGVRREP